MDNELGERHRRHAGLRAWHVIAVVVCAIGILIVAAVASPNWNLVRAPVAEYLSGRLDRPVAINGDFKVRVSLQPEIEINGLTIGNASWGTHPMMAQIERLRFRVDIAPLFRGQVVIPEAQLVRAAVALERNSEGTPNWEFRRARSSDGSAPEIGTLLIQEGQLVYEDAPVETKVTLAIDSATEPQQGSVAMIRFAGRGSLRKEVFQIEGRAETLLSLAHQGKPYQLDVRAIAGDTRVSFAGHAGAIQAGDDRRQPRAERQRSVQVVSHRSRTASMDSGLPPARTFRPRRRHVVVQKLHRKGRCQRHGGRFLPEPQKQAADHHAPR